MQKRRKMWSAVFLMCFIGFSFSFMFVTSYSAEADNVVRIFIDGQEIISDVDPIMINDRTMVPIRAIGEGLGMDVKWDQANQHVLINRPAIPVVTQPPDVPVVDHASTSILGNSVASAAEMRTMLLSKNPHAPAELPELYIQIGRIYGIRGDIAFCQAAKETGWWKFGGLVEPYQNNYCGLGATGRAATGDENLNGADPTRVYFKAGVHGAIFETPADGVEAHIQHLYAYTSKQPLPAGRNLLDPRFTLVTRGLADTWSDLNGKWAVPGNGYGESILSDYYAPILGKDLSRESVSSEQRLRQLEVENEQLRMEIQRLNGMLDAKV